ncbi:MAG TPA: LemA family protein [Alteraurantiacibacter sp.]|jgi:LemA protein
MANWIIAGIALPLLLYLIVIYNRLVRLRALMREAWSGITVQLRRRADLVPNLVSAVKAYASHERDLLEAVTAQRGVAAGTKGVGETAQADALLSGMLGRLMAVAEAYPALKADANFRELQQELAETEDELAGARRYYNATVRDLNTAVESFPAILVAAPMGFRQEEPYSDPDTSIRTAPNVEFG